MERYVSRFKSKIAKETICTKMTVDYAFSRFPILYFAVERNSSDIIRALCTAGAQPNERIGGAGSKRGLPLLAYAVFSAEYYISDTTDAVITLLSMGAKPDGVPRDMWVEYLKAPRKNIQPSCSRDSWCTFEVREALCRNLNLMQRYVLYKADSVNQQPNQRRGSIARAHSLAPLFETVYHIIGQESAIRQAVDCIMDYCMFGDKAPLVLFFTGPSGHGKTELARRMGDLLSLEMHTVDCTEMKHETDIFGPKKPYCGWNEGAPLNNFLWDKAGERCVVFLDEVEKTIEEVRNAMLKLFESGMYKDRRLDKPIDCSKVIWVLASNLGCEVIQKFWADHLQDKTELQQQRVPRSTFEKSLKQSIMNILGAPFTGRLTAIVPFMPFNAGEQAVATYKFMRHLWNNVRKPIDINSKAFPRHLFVNYNDDGAIAAHIAKNNYSSETGARPLQHAVNRDIRGKLSRVFLNGKEMVKDEMNDEALQNYEVRLVSTEDVDEIHVETRATKSLQTFEKTYGFSPRTISLT